MHTKRSKAERREEAEARTHYYSILTDDEKLALCESRRGNSAREVDRITARMEGNE